MNAFKPGDRVEGITSSESHTAGQQGTVVRRESGLIMVKLDKQTELADAVTIIDLSVDDGEKDAAFQADELRHVVTPIGLTHAPCAPPHLDCSRGVSFCPATPGSFQIT